MNDGGNLTDVNGSLYRLPGYTRQELLKMNLTDLVDPAQLKIEPIAFEPVINGEHNIRERRLQKKDERRCKKFDAPMAGFFPMANMGNQKPVKMRYHDNTCCLVALKENNNQPLGR